MNTRIKRSLPTKITTMIVSITVLCLALGFTVVGVVRVQEMREERLATASLVARVVGEYSVADLAFRDREESKRTLGLLRSFDDIEHAAIYDKQGQLFAAYDRDPTLPVEAATSVDPDAAGFKRIGDGFVEVLVPIVYEGVRYGTILLRGSTTGLQASIRAYIFGMAGILLALLAVSLLVARLVQRKISEPILRLAAVAEGISRGDQASSRADRVSSDEVGLLTGVFNSMLDELQGRERELRQAHEKLQAVIDGSPLAVVGTDQTGAVQLFNREAERLFNLHSSEAIGSNFAELPVADELKQQLQSCLHGRPAVDVDVHWHRDDGTELDVWSSAAPLGDTETGLTGCILIAGDVTERKSTEAALAERDHQLQQAQKMEVIGRLAGGVAHDFNNLLTVVTGAASLMRIRAERGGDITRDIDMIESAAERGSALTRRLLAFVRRSSKKTETLDLSHHLSEIGRMLRSILGEVFELEVINDVEHAPAIMDAGQFEQVLLNLVINARDAMPDGGRIEIHLSDADAVRPARLSDSRHWLALTVRDTGTGMDEETLARIFEPFFTTKARGTGLGLATVSEIVRKEWQGDITVESTPGEGTTIRLWIPRADAHARAALSERPPQPTGPLTILLAEDEAAVRNVATDVLRQHGFDVIPVANGSEALQVLQDGREIDMLLTDVVMPGMNGPELAQRALQLRPDLPVLYMSGYAGDVLHSRGLTEDNAPLLAKPFTASTLISKLREVLEASPANSQAAG